MSDLFTKRQFVACRFRPGDRRLYTYHNDGDPVAVGDEVSVPDRSGDGWNRVVVAEISDVPPKFETKAINGLAPPLTDLLDAGDDVDLESSRGDQ